ncbi:WD40 repeat domain-containing protein [Aspergillus homomorphus CBS 101889]|uniref:WD40 repeat-like protein n=1 Tax=Aspergillus homomorphus (strain CBS 101889) TaxID=1450537 RepID=A0A395HK53_ASPHC|nr:WD40 repeat-like protein [Aspergillus homomorphus CBS 101889]RAL07585.1 WD40 repeat-like protein [Aspergillus homomorphus CBS 101889]
MPKSNVKEKTRQKSEDASSRLVYEAGKPIRGQDDDNDITSSEGSSDESDIPEKDEAELKLEQMLFGDDDGFLGALKTQHEHGLVLADQSDDEMGDGDDSEDDDEEQDLSKLADSDLFFLDSGPGPVSTYLDEVPATRSDEEDSDDETSGLPALWHDSDDERIAISLASHQRLRKLRVVESEDVISGKEYIRRLRRQFVQLNPVPDWANPEKNQQKDDSDADDMDTDDEEPSSTQPLAKLLQGATDLVKLEDNTGPGGRRKMRQEVIDITRLKDVGKDQPSAIDSLSFHPHYPLLLSSGQAATLFLHHISPSAQAPNPLLTSFHIRHTPIHTSAFHLPSGNRIFASGRRRYLHIWDLETGKVDKVNGTSDRKEEQKTMERFKLSPCGRYVGLVGSSRKGGGLINILDSNTAQWIAQVRVDGRGGVSDFAWWSDGEGLTVVSKNGEVSEWDSRLNRVVARWVDAGAVGTTVLSLGGRSGRTQLGGDRWVAIGSSSGIVNVYDRREWAAAYATAAASNEDEATQTTFIPRNPEPVRVLDQLTTPISHLVFAPDGQFFVMASRWKRDALRIVHLPSCTVYRNWPTSNTPFGRISAVAISPNSEQLAVGNEQGRIRLWEIRG